MTTFKLLTNVCGHDCMIRDGMTFEEAKVFKERLERVFRRQTYWIEEAEQVDKGAEADEWDFYPDRD